MAAYAFLGVAGAQSISKLFNGENPLDPFTGYGPGVGRDIHDFFNVSKKGVDTGINSLDAFNKNLPLIAGFGGLLLLVFILKK
jgi:hypothetical protein